MPQKLDGRKQRFVKVSSEEKGYTLKLKGFIPKFTPKIPRIPLLDFEASLYKKTKKTIERAK